MWPSYVMYSDDSAWTWTWTVLKHDLCLDLTVWYLDLGLAV